MNYAETLERWADPEWVRMQELIQHRENQERIEAERESRLYNKRSYLKDMIPHDPKPFLDSHCRGCWDIDGMSEEELNQMEAAIMWKD